MGYIFDFGIGKPVQETTLSPQSRTMNLATVHTFQQHMISTLWGLVLSKLKRIIGDSAGWNFYKCVSEENTEIQNQHLRLDLLPFYNTLQSKFRVWTIQYVQRKPVQATKVKNNLKNFAPWMVWRVIGQKCLMKGLINVSHMRDGEKANMSRPKTQTFIMPLIPFNLHIQPTSKCFKWWN